MRNNFLKRVISIVLALTLVIGGLPMAVFATERAEQVTTFESVESTLAPGITQTINSGYAADGKLINYYISIADINRDDVGVHTTYKDAQCVEPGMAKMSEQAVSMTQLHSNPNDEANYIPYYAIVSGVNGDGYNTGSGAPSGAHVMNGVSGFGIAKTANSSWFAIFEDGTALCGANDADWDEAIKAHGPVQEAIGGFQLVRKNGVDIPYKESDYLNSGRYPRSFVGVTADNKVVFMAVDGNGSGGSAGTNYNESLELMDEVGCTYILCLDGGGSATYISRPVGSNEVEVTSKPSDGSERAVSNGLVMYTSTPPSDVFSYANVTADNYYVTPGSTVGISAVGVSPAGTAAEIPENAVWAVTNGTIEDGKFVSDGTVGEAKVTLTVDGEVVGETTINVVYPESIAFTRDSMTIPYNTTIDLEVVAKYGLYTVPLNEDDVTFTVNGENVGTIDGWRFTSPESGEGTTITVKVNNVADVISDTIVVKFGRASEVLFDFEAGTIGADLKNWRVNDAADGKHSVADVSIVTKETGKVHSGESALAFHYPMDEKIHGTEFWAANSLVWTGEPIEINKATSMGFWVYIPEDAKQFALYFGALCHDENGKVIGNAGETMEIYNDDNINNMEYSGWHYIKTPINFETVYIEDGKDAVAAGTIKNKANCLIEFYAVNIDSWKHGETNFAGDFTFYIDDFTIDYSDAVDDREAPIFSGMTYAVEGMSDAATLNGQTVNEKVVDFAGLVAEDLTNPNNATGIDAASAVAYIDGVPVDCEYSNGMITVTDAVLTNGVHTIRMGIADKMGNYSETKRQITVKSGNNDKSVRVRPQDSTLNYILNGAVYWVDVEVDAIETVKSIEMKLDLDSMNNWELEQLDVLHGFDCEYSFETANEKAENILTLKFTRNSDYLSKTGTAVIASLPIRVWDYVSSDDHSHKNAVEAWNCAYGCAPALSIDVDTEKGIVTYVDETSHTFSSTDIHTLCVSYTYGLRMKNYDSAYWNSHSYHLHNAVAIADKEATCTVNGYTGRTYCEACASPVNWGTTVEATGHTFEIKDGVLLCNCGQTYTGVWEDGKNYIDGTVSDGWINDSYWQDGVKLTGVQLIGGYYYDFGKDGVCKGQAKYTGLFYDESVSAWRYSLFGELAVGWHQINGEWHLFRGSKKLAASGELVINGVTYQFNEQGMTKGAWHTTEQGTRYYYSNLYYQARNEDYQTFVEIDGKTYNFDHEGYITIGTYALRPAAFIMKKNVFEFGEDGALIRQITQQGPIKCSDGGVYYINEDGYVPTDAGLVQYGEDYYYVVYSGKIAMNSTRNISVEKTNGLLSAGTYTFGSDGKMVKPQNGIVEEDGVFYYYINGVKQKNLGLIQIDGDYYYVCYSGKLKQNNVQTLTESQVAIYPNISPGTYYFGSDCKMEIPDKDEIKDGIVEEDGLFYYYINGVKQKNLGLIQIDGDYYYVCYSGKLKQGNFQTLTELHVVNYPGISAGTYYFGNDCKMVI